MQRCLKSKHIKPKLHRSHFIKSRLGCTAEATEANKKIFFTALEQNLGLVERASKASGIKAITHYMWLKSDPEYQARVEELIELKRDHVENKLTQLVTQGEPSCVTFTAKCLLRKRGYEQSIPIINGDDKNFVLSIPDTIIKTTLQAIYGSTNVIPTTGVMSNGPPDTNT